MAKGHLPVGKAVSISAILVHWKILMPLGSYYDMQLDIIIFEINDLVIYAWFKIKTLDHHYIIPIRIF